MNIKAELEREHSKTSTTAIVNYVGGNEVRFEKLMEVFLHGEKRLSQRAAWPLSYVGANHPELIVKALPRLLVKLAEPGTHDAIKRNILRALQETEIPEKYEAPVVDACFRFMRNESMAVAIRAFAITTAARICKKYPELNEELVLLLAEIGAMPHTAAITVRIKKALKELGRGQSKY